MRFAAEHAHQTRRGTISDHVWLARPRRGASRSTITFLGVSMLAACAAHIDTASDEDAGEPDVRWVDALGPEECGAATSEGALGLTCPRLSRCGAEAQVPKRIRVATWNIKVASKSNVAEIVRVLGELDADVVLLQEVDRDVQRSGLVDQPAEIARALKMRYAFAPTLEIEGGTYGIVALSRLPIERVRRLGLSNEGAREVRTAIELHVCSGSARWRIINHHADYEHPAARRSVLELLGAIEDEADVPTLLAGDFNQKPREAGPRACTDAELVDVVGELDPSPTFSASRIDYVFADRKLSELVRDAHVISSRASDHRPVVVEFAPL